MKVVVAQPARAELRAAVRWYEERRENPGVEFKAEVDAGVEAIRSAPERWQPITATERRYLLHRIPSFIIYPIPGDTVRIVAIAHARRTPFSWKDRT